MREEKNIRKVKRKQQRKRKSKKLEEVWKERLMKERIEE